jgi:hypothetical protein
VGLGQVAQAEHASEKVFLLVIPNEVRNPSGFVSQEKEGFLTRSSGFGMTTLLVLPQPVVPTPHGPLYG